MNNIFLAAAAGISALLGVGGNHTVPPPDQHTAQVHATTTGKGHIDLSCVAAAVAAREASLQGAITANTGTVTSAYSARASALASAYAQSDNDSIRKAVKTAWGDFRAALQLAHQNWKTAQQGAWSQFKIALKACGTGAASVSDSANASADANAAGGTN
jgi:hypothetical protein